MAKSTLTISIGRNVPNKSVANLSPKVIADFDGYLGAWVLNENDWLDFQMSVESIFRGGKAETKANGFSSWNGDEEETAIFQWFDAPRPTAEQEQELRQIANYYGQESIAVTYAKPKFI